MQTQKTIKLGESITMTFNEIASSGYVWVVKEIDSNLDVVKDVPILSEDDLHNMGFGGGRDIQYIVTPSTTGNFEIEFQNKRPWEEDVTSTHTLKITVTP